MNGLVAASTDLKEETERKQRKKKKTLTLKKKVAQPGTNLPMKLFVCLVVEVTTIAPQQIKQHDWHT